MTRIEVRLLGPVRITVDGADVDIGPPRQRTVFAVLAADAGRVVPADTLVDRVWGPVPPRRVRDALHVYVARIRGGLRQVGQDRHLRRDAPGYVLDIDRLGVDVLQFRALVDRARKESSPETRAELLRRALDLWVGEPLADIACDWAAVTRTHWEQQRVEAVLAWAEAQSAAGHPESVVADLADLADQYPVNESVAATLMRALCATGRYTDALDRFRAVRRLLVDQFGVDPGPELRELQGAILRGTMAPDRSVPAGRDAAEQPLLSGVGRRPAAGPSVTPAQLPAGARLFAGRTTELAELDKTLPEDGNGATAAPVIAIVGTAGVGKTTLAVRWAHRVADLYPDGQLFVNLHGFDPIHQPLGSHEALGGLLGALGVTPERLPGNAQARVGLYRSLLSGRRMIVVLDNARDAEQVRPLLPGSPECAVVITSRNQLDGLVATDGVHRLRIGLLHEDEARHLLAAHLGSDRLAAEPQATTDIIGRCARLPLALALVAAHATGRPEWRLTTIADSLREVTGGFDVLGAGDVRTDVRAVLTWSYETLSAEAAQMFRLIALHPGPTISVTAAAALADVPESRARRAIAELTDANLLADAAPERHVMHDLLRLLGVELGARLDRDTAPRARQRMCDYYTGSAWRAIQLVRPKPGAAEPTQGQRFDSRDDAIAWFEAELAVLLAVAQQCAADAATHGPTAVDLLRSLSNYLPSRGRWDEFTQLATLVADATSTYDDPGGRALALNCLAYVDRRDGNLDVALGRLAEALVIRMDLGDRYGEASSLDTMGIVLDGLGQLAAAAICLARALRVHQDMGHVAQAGTSLHNLAEVYARADRPAATKRFLTRALRYRRAAGDPFGEAATLVTLGQTHAILGEHAEAARWLDLGIEQSDHLGYQDSAWEGLLCRAQLAIANGDPAAAHEDLRRAAVIAERLGDPYAAAHTLRQIGRVHRALGDTARAEACLDQAAATLATYTGPGRGSFERVSNILEREGPPNHA